MGCPSGAYKLHSCTEDGTSCTDWQTQCDMRSDGGWTLVAFNGPTHNKLASHSQWPSPSKERKAGASFLYQDSFDELRIKKGVIEGVACHKSQPEALSASCKWAHSTCDAACADEVRKLWGYNYGTSNYVKPSCKTGNVFGQGAAKTYCSGYGDPVKGASVLGWQADIHGVSHCWAGRGSCCSSAGGSGTCAGSDSGMGNYFAMVWVQ